MTYRRNVIRAALSGNTHGPIVTDEVCKVEILYFVEDKDQSTPGSGKNRWNAQGS